MGMRYDPIKGGQIVRTKDGKTYSRKNSAYQTSSVLKARQKCVARTLRGKKLGSQAAVRSAFTAAQAQCRTGRAAKGKAEE